mgnify:CR=1 FL=1
MAQRRLTFDDVTRQLQDLPGWELTGLVLHARHDAPDVPSAVRIIAEVFEVAEEMNHHPDVDLRWKRLRWQLSTHDSGGVTQLDIELAHRISDIAGRAGATAMAAKPAIVEIGVDTADAAAIAPFWAAALDVPASSDGDAIVITDPSGVLPQIWFQGTDSPAAGRNRLHIDVTVPLRQVPARRTAVEAAGGRLVSGEEFAPSWWVYADADGNEVCICSPKGRDD